VALAELENYQGSLKFERSYRSAVLTAARDAGSQCASSDAGLRVCWLTKSRAGSLFYHRWSVATVVITRFIRYPAQCRRSQRQFARHASLFVQVMLWVLIPGAVFVGWGPQLSRLLYGSKWIAADPLVCRAVFACVSMVLSLRLYCKRRLRSAFLSSAAAAILCVPAILAVRGVVQTYAWIAAAGQLVAVLIVTKLTSRSLEETWPCGCAAAGCGCAAHSFH
jgi:hypothetical protein